MYSPPLTLFAQPMLLDRDEYIEQAYFYKTLRERMRQGLSTQELLVSIRHELLSTTKLPMALEYMVAELRLTGGFATAMAQLDHYFTPFQAYVIGEAELQEGRFDFQVALEILQREAEYRSGEPTRPGLFLYQFEVLCRNRLGYDRGLAAVAADVFYDEHWREWILTVRRQLGLVDLADLIYVRSENYRKKPGEADRPILFGEKEGRIAAANRHKDPLFLFSALARHLGYPSIPRHRPEETTEQVLPLLKRRVEHLETRIKLLEEELRGGINITKFYKKENDEPENDES